MNTRTVSTLLRKAAQVEYSLLRTPLSVAAGRASARFGERSALAGGLERGIAVLDTVAARFLTPDSTRTPDPQPADRPAPPDPAPAAPPVPSDAEPDERPAPGEDLPAGEQEAVEHLADELLEEQADAPMTGELGEDDELRRVQAELHAKHLVEEQEEQQEQDRPGGTA